MTQTVSRGVRLFRAVDGVCFGGVGRCGGLYVDFGNDGEVSELELVWRTLQSKSEVTVAKSDQFRRWISAGQATLDIDDGFDPSQIKRLTITRITPYYLGKDGTEIQKTIFPYAVLTALADLGRTNITVSLNTPIFPQ